MIDIDTFNIIFFSIQITINPGQTKPKSIVEDLILCNSGSFFIFLKKGRGMQGSISKHVAQNEK